MRSNTKRKKEEREKVFEVKDEREMGEIWGEKRRSMEGRGKGESEKGRREER